MHPRLHLDHSIPLIDICGRLYLCENTYAKAAETPFKALAKRYHMEEAMIEYLWRFGRVLLERVKEDMRLYDVNMIKWLLGEDLPGFSQRFLPYLTTFYEGWRTENSQNRAKIAEILHKKQAYTIVPVADVETAASKSRESPLSLFPYSRIENDIQRIKRFRIERLANQQLCREQEADLAEKRVKCARKRLEMRKIGLGIGKGVVEEVSMFDFESVEGIEEPWDMNIEEIEDLERFRILQKRYKRFFTALFHRFAASGFAPKPSEASDFDYLAVRKAQLTVAELVKVLSHLSLLPAIIAIEELRQLLKAYCVKVMGKAEFTAVGVEEFRGVMEQVGWAVAERIGAGRWGRVLQFKAFMEYIQHHLLDQSLIPYFSPNPGICDLTISHRLNHLLASTPSTPLPFGFKLASFQDISIQFTLPKELNIGESKSTALEVIDEMVVKAIGVHYIEARGVVTTQIYAKGVGKEGEGVGLGEELRWEVWNMREEDRGVGWECAKTLERLLRAVSLGVKGEKRTNRSISLPHPSPSPPKSSPLSKRITESQARLFARIKEVEDRKRKEIAEDREKADKELQEAEKKQLKYAKERELRGLALQNWLENRAKSDIKTAQTDRICENTERKEDYRKLQRRLEGVIRAKQEHWKALKEAEMTALDREMEYRAMQRRGIARQLGINRDLVGRKQAKAEELREFEDSQPVQSLFSAYWKQISFIFTFFCKRIERSLDFETGQLPLSAYVRLCLTLNIVPTLLSQDQNTFIFKSITHKKPSIQGKTATIALEEFKSALVHIADIGREVLNERIGRQGGQLDVETVKGLLGMIGAERSIGDLKEFLRVRMELPRAKSHVRYSSASKATPGAASHFPNGASSGSSSVDYRGKRGKMREIAAGKGAFRSSKTALEGGHRAATSFDSGVSGRPESNPYV